MHVITEPKTMSKPDFYQRAPIILGILQIRFPSISNFDIAKIKSVAAKIKKDFPNIDERYSQGILINNNQDETNISLDEKKFDNIQISNQDKKRLFVISHEKFTYQAKDTYQGWEDFIKGVKLFWEEFSNTFSIETIHGVSLRYLNKFELPLDFKSFNDYFNSYLEDKTSNHHVNQYQFRFSTLDPKNNMTINIAHSLEKPTNQFHPYLLDIDVLKNEMIENSDAIWKNFEVLRTKKNELFNQSITEKTVELIK